MQTLLTISYRQKMAIWSLLMAENLNHESYGNNLFVIVTSEHPHNGPTIMAWACQTIGLFVCLT